MLVTIQKAAHLFKVVVNQTAIPSAHHTSIFRSHQRHKLVSFFDTRKFTTTTPTSTVRTRTTKRGAKVRPELLSGGRGVCAAYHLDDTIRLSTVPSALSTLTTSSSQLIAPITTELTSLSDVAHAGVKILERGTPHYAHIFIFSSGAVIFWHVPRSLRKRLLQVLKPITSTTPPPRVRMRDFDHEFGVSIEDGIDEEAPKFRDDRVVITKSTTPRQLLALSYGLAQSVELVILEASVDRLALRTRMLPETLAATGRVGTAVTPLIGELLAARYRLSLVSDIWDVPEYFWTNSDIEPLYTDAANAVELRQRANVLDARVSVISDALDMINGEIRAQASNRVERAILALIAVEVVIELAKLGVA